MVLSSLTGLRTKEARALRRAEVDREAGTLAVYRSVRAKGDTKTRRSRLVLELPGQVAAAHRRGQAPEQLRAGESWRDSDLAFCRADGTGLDRWQVGREFAAITKAAGLEEAGAAALVRVHPERQ
jgi:integrase